MPTLAPIAQTDYGHPDAEDHAALPLDTLFPATAFPAGTVRERWGAARNVVSEHASWTHSSFPHRDNEPYARLIIGDGDNLVWDVDGDPTIERPGLVFPIESLLLDVSLSAIQVTVDAFRRQGFAVTVDTFAPPEPYAEQERSTFVQVQVRSR